VITNKVVFALIFRGSKRKQTLYNFARIISEHSNATFPAFYHWFIDDAVTSVPVVPFFNETVQIVTGQKVPV